MRASPADGSKVFETYRRTQQEKETGAKHVQSTRRIYHNVMFCRFVERARLPGNEIKLRMKTCQHGQDN